ncbi:MAG: D-alanyl-D-alanine carboxypeptidase [Clostridiales bacterium]|nr:D-alanyl-D-alanine carboxypeptidase [Clostridiales bacterium]
MKKKIFITFVLVIMVGLTFVPMNLKQTFASFETDVSHKASVLIERETGRVLNGYNEHEKMPIASVTKLMTVLLTLENIEKGKLSLDDEILVSENASGMGGSQVFLDANASYKVGELLKSVIVCSANDSSVALAENIAGSESNFVRLMNERAKELNMFDTNYSNATGLPSAEGYSSAFDQAIVLNKVLSYDTYHEYSSIWNEEFVHPEGRTTQMTNTNKLSRYYEGCVGGKTGSTNEAKYCLAVGAKRNNTNLIAVVLGADNSKNRFKLASDLLNFGFNNFESKLLFGKSDLADTKIKIKGMDREIRVEPVKEFSYVINKNENLNYSTNIVLPDMLKSVRKGDKVGFVEIAIDGVVIEKIDIVASESAKELSIWDYFKEVVNG